VAEHDGLSSGRPKITAEQRRRRERRQALARYAERELGKLKAKRDAEKAAAVVSSKPKREKRSKARNARKTALIEAAERTMVNQLVTPEAQAKGAYHVVDFKLTEGAEDAGRKKEAKSIRVVRNLGGTPVERWHHRGALDERQMAAILFYQEAWHRMIGEPRVVANWSAVIVRQAVGAVELYAGSQLAAKESLRLLDQEVFFREPVEWFHVWQNVVIFDEPAGVAGSRAGYIVKKSAEAVAREIVRNLAMKIADIVIDQSRRDFGDLLVDLDAPRKSGAHVLKPGEKS
jgi:hypothetical protein